MRLLKHTTQFALVIVLSIALFAGILFYGFMNRPEFVGDHQLK